MEKIDNEYVQQGSLFDFDDDLPILESEPLKVTEVEDSPVIEGFDDGDVIAELMSDGYDVDTETDDEPVFSPAIVIKEIEETSTERNSPEKIVCDKVAKLPEGIQKALDAFTINEKTVYLQIAERPGCGIKEIAETRNFRETRRRLQRLIAGGLVRAAGSRKKRVYYPCESDIPTPLETKEGLEIKIEQIRAELQQEKQNHEITKRHLEDALLDMELKRREIDAMHAGQWMKQIRATDEAIETTAKAGAQMNTVSEQVVGVAQKQRDILEAIEKHVDDARSAVSEILGPQKPNKDSDESSFHYYMISLPAYYITKVRYIDWVRHFLWVVLFCLLTVSVLSNFLLYNRCEEQSTEIHRLEPFEPKYTTIKRWFGFEGDGKWIRRSDELDVMYAHQDEYKENLDALRKRIGMPNTKENNETKQ